MERKYKQRNYCGNCGKFGHLYRNCNEPITSYGVIMINIDSHDKKITDTLINKFCITIDSDNENDDIDDIINNGIIPIHNNNTAGIKCETPDDIETFCTYKDNIRFLMIRRKHTLGYIEFVRGRYSIDNIDGISFLFKQMTPDEIKKISQNSFEILWDDLWAGDENKLNYQEEFTYSKAKFEKLINNNNGNLNLNFYVTNVKPNWNYPEWGFPKGRRSFQESNLLCSIREFKEESGYKDDEFVLLDRLEPIEESFIGTNGVNYKHIYYLAINLTDRKPIVDMQNKHQMNEVGEIGWFTYDEAIRMIRPHHTERKKLLTELYMYIINTINEINKL